MPTNFRAIGNGDFGSSTYWTAPLATDDDVRVQEGLEDFNAGLNQAGLDFLSVNFEEGYGDDSTTVGLPAAPLRCDINRSGAGTFDFAARCQAFYCRGGTSSALWANVNWRPRNPSANFLPQDMTMTLARLQNGSALIPDSVIVGAGGLFVYGGSHVLEHHASNVPDITVMGGALHLKRDWTSLRVKGTGRVTIELNPGVTGGTIEIDSSSAEVVIVQGNVGVVTVWSGRLDKTRLRRAATCTSQTWHPTAIEIKERGGALLTGTRTNIPPGPTQV